MLGEGLYDLLYPLPYKNDSGAMIPAYGIVMAKCDNTQWETTGGMVVMGMQQPDGSPDAAYFVNGPMDVANGAHGRCGPAVYPTRALYDSGWSSPAAGQMCGADDSGYDLKECLAGFRVVGEPAGGSPYWIYVVRLAEPAGEHFWGKAQSDWSADIGGVQGVNVKKLVDDIETGDAFVVELPSAGGQDPNVREDEIIAYTWVTNGSLDEVAVCVSGYLDDKIGTIKMWSGNEEDIPPGWHLCDGTEGAIDLIDKFVMGSSGTVGRTGGYATHGAPGVNQHEDHAVGVSISELDIAIRDHHDHGYLYHDPINSHEPSELDHTGPDDHPALTHGTISAHPAGELSHTGPDAHPALSHDAIDAHPALTHTGPDPHPALSHDELNPHSPGELGHTGLDSHTISEHSTLDPHPAHSHTGPDSHSEILAHNQHSDHPFDIGDAYDSGGTGTFYFGEFVKEEGFDTHHTPHAPHALYLPHSSVGLCPQFPHDTIDPHDILGHSTIPPHGPLDHNQLSDHGSLAHTTIPAHDSLTHNQLSDHPSQSHTTIPAHGPLNHSALPNHPSQSHTTIPAHGPLEHDPLSPHGPLSHSEHEVWAAPLIASASASPHSVTDNRPPYYVISFIQRIN